MPPICTTWPQATKTEHKNEKQNPSRMGKHLMKSIIFA